MEEEVGVIDQNGEVYSERHRVYDNISWKIFKMGRKKSQKEKSWNLWLLGAQLAQGHNIGAGFAKKINYNIF